MDKKNYQKELKKSTFSNKLLIFGKEMIIVSSQVTNFIEQLVFVIELIID